MLCKGWGTTTSGGQTSNKLLEVNQDVVSTNTCKNVFDTQVKFTILKQNIGIWGFILFYCLKGSKMYSFKNILISDLVIFFNFEDNCVDVTF